MKSLIYKTNIKCIFSITDFTLDPLDYFKQHEDIFVELD